MEKLFPLIAAVVLFVGVNVGIVILVASIIAAASK